LFHYHRPVSELGRILIGIGVLLVIVGLVVLFAGRLGVGKLPGDIIVRRGNFTFYFPLVTSLLLSLLLTLFLWLFRRKNEIEN
jgi:hypothetical protein